MTIKNLNVKKGKVVIGNYSEVEILRVTSVSEVANLNLEPEHKNIIKKLIIIGTNPDLTGIETIGADDDELPNLESIELQNMAEVPEDLFNTYPYYNNWLKSFSAPEAEIIGERAFSNCAALLEINLPKTTNIIYYAFYDCDALREVNLPEATNIVGRNFYDCDALAEVYLPNAVTIGDFAFESCDVLRN